MNAMLHRWRHRGLLFVALVIGVCAGGLAVAAPDDDGLSLHIAEPKTDGIEGETDGIWQPVSPEAAERILAQPDLVVRTTGEEVELLLSPARYDVSPSDVEIIRESFGPMGERVLIPHLTDEGRERVQQFTEDQLGKYLVEVLDGEVIFAARIMAPLREFSVPYEAAPRLRRWLADARYVAIEDTYVGDGILLTIWHLVGILVLAVVIVLAAIPGAKLPAPKHRRVWMTVAGLIGLIVGGYLNAYSYSVGHASTPEGDVIVLAHHISILGGVIGGIVGAALGAGVGFLAERAFRRVRQLLRK